MDSALRTLLLFFICFFNFFDRSDEILTCLKVAETIQPETIQPVLQNARFQKSPILCWQARSTLARLRRSLILAELSLAELAEMYLADLSEYFWLNCLNFKSAELSLAELSLAELFGRGLTTFLWNPGTYRHKILRS